MAKLISHDFGWYSVRDTGWTDENGVIVTVKVRVWHPGFWLFWLKCKLGRA